MPLSRIALKRGKSAEYKRSISNSLHQAMVEVIGLPAEHKFHLIDEYDAGNFIYHPSFLGIDRSGDLVIINIVLRSGRTRAVRTQLHGRIVELLAASPGVRPQDVFVFLIENDYADWSLGNGDAPLMRLLEEPEA